MSNDRAFDRCLEAFIQRDYAGCVREGMPLLPTGLPLVLLQLVLISLQRLGQTVRARELGGDILAATEQEPWDHLLSMLTLDQAHLIDVLAQARDDEQRYQAHYYFGARLLTLGQRGPARAAFAACAALNTPCHERELARVESNSPSSPARELSGCSRITRLFGRIRSFFTGLFGFIGNSHGRGIRQVIFERPLTSEEKEQQFQLSLLLEMIGKSLYDSGRNAEARPYFEQALAILREVRGGEDPDIAVCLGNLGELLRVTGDLEPARPCLEQALLIQRKVLGEEHPATAATYNNLGQLLRETGDLAAARSCLEQSLAIRRKVLGEEHPDTGIAYDNLGLLLSVTRDDAAARSNYERALAIFKKVLGEEHPDTAIAYENLGRLFRETGNPAAARPCLEQALAIRRKVLGEQHPVTATSFHDLGTLLRDMKDYAAARPCLEQALAIRRKVLGEDHPSTAACLIKLGSLLQTMEDYASAKPYYQDALAFCRKVRGEEHPETASMLDLLSSLLKDMGSYAAALPYCEQALAVRRKMLGEEHPDTAASLHLLGSLHKGLGRYAEARADYEQALAIRRKVLGAEHLYMATCLNDLGGLLLEMGDYQGARECLESALLILRRTLGEEHAITATCLSNLGGVLWAVGKFAAARGYLEQALATFRKVASAEQFAMAGCLVNLGKLRHAMGDYAGARSCLQEVSTTFKKLSGEGNPETASYLLIYGDLLISMGDYAVARSCYEQALAIDMGKLGEEHPSTARCLNNLGELLRTIGDYGAARTCQERALVILRNVLGEEHPDANRCLNNLGIVLWNLGDHAAARSRLEQGLAIRRRVLGDEHPDTATAFHNLGVILWTMGDYEAARSHHEQALAIRRKVLGEEHPDTGSDLESLAILWVISNRFGEALNLLEQASRIDDRMIGQVFAIGSERQRMAYLHTIKVNLDAFLSLVSQHLAHSPDAVRAAVDLVLRRKAIGAEALTAQRDAVLGGRYPHLREQLEQLTLLQSQIAQKMLAGPGPGEDPVSYRQVLDQWRAECERLEQELAPQIPEMNLERRLRAADRRAVALALPQGITLVEFVHFYVTDFRAAAARGKSGSEPARYLAFVISAGEPDDVRMLDLGEAKPIDRMIADFRKTLTGESEQRGGGGKETLGDPASPSGRLDAGARLRSAIFGPVAEGLAGRTQWLLAPDGDLARLPFEVLPTMDGQLMIDHYQISYLATGRDALRFGAASTSQPTVPVVAADPDYDLGIQDTAGARQPAASDDVDDELSPRRHSRAPELDRLYFPRLPATRVEGEQVAKMLSTHLHVEIRPQMDRLALETRLKSLRSPWIVHLATHGFFLQDQPRDDVLGRRHFRILPTTNASGAGETLEPSGRRLESPLLRSGLALAGANWKSKQFIPPAEAEDGLLTAEDVAGLDLLSTELVVLSACETGLGAVQIGEGVFGLRRSVVVAGAKTLVMSLWKVPDDQTRELMEDFYSKVLGGSGRAVALSEAQRAMKKKYPDPYYWGAFICQGDPGPLSTTPEGFAGGVPGHHT